MLKLTSIVLLSLFTFHVAASEMLEVNGGSIEYEVKGDGDTAVLFDAGALSGMSGWDSIWDNLPGEITAIRFSRLGEGNSGTCEGQRSALDYVEEVDQLLSGLNIDRPIVYVGHSLGGITARNFATTHAGDVKAMLMVEPATPRDIDIVIQLNPANGQEEIDEIKQSDYAAGEDKWCFLDVIWDKSKVPGFAEIGDIPVTLIASVKVPEQPSSVFLSTEGRRLWGQYQSEWAEQFPRGKTILTDKSGHFVQDDEPELVVNELIKLLDRL